MNQSALLDRTDGYLHSQFRDSRSPWGSPVRIAPFITISREAGSGGSSLARLLARKLNAESAADIVWRVYEGNVTARMLQANQLSPSVARFLPEDRVPELAATIGELVGLHPNLWELMQKTNEAMRTYAAQGHVILVGRGANFATADLPNGTHVRLVAPVDHRARYLAERYNISESEARALNVKCEAARRRYVKATFGTEVSDSSAYDLTINTARVPLRLACDLICRRVLEHSD
jgi:cytidylate kinase